MKRSIRYILLFIGSSLLISCEKAIDLKLADTTPQYVIEGVVTNEAGGSKVSISQTKNFTDNNSFNAINGAQVSISNNDTTYNLTQTASGVYQNNTLTGRPGQTYQLTVQTQGKMFTSMCTMPQPVALDSIYLTIDKLNNNKDGSIRKYVTVKYTDPSAIKNYYRFVQYINGRKEKTVFLDNDEFTNGQTVNSQLRFDNDNDDPTRDIRPGNQVTIEMLSISSDVYKYWYSLTSGADGGGNNAAPANPLSNIQGGSLGYFSAHAIRRKSLVAL